MFISDVIIQVGPVNCSIVTQLTRKVSYFHVDSPKIENVLNRQSLRRYSCIITFSITSGFLSDKDNKQTIKLLYIASPMMIYKM